MDLNAKFAFEREAATEISPGAGTPMVSDLRVQELPNTQTEELVCALCGQPFVPSPSVEMVYSGRLPIGLVCPECIAHPSNAAEAARARAREIRTLARASETALPRHMWIRLLQIAHSRADYWDDLAGRIEHMSGWQLNEDLTGNDPQSE
jgi:hypothetical protein